VWLWCVIKIVGEREGMCVYLFCPLYMYGNVSYSHLRTVVLGASTSKCAADVNLWNCGAGCGRVRFEHRWERRCMRACVLGVVYVVVCHTVTYAPWCLVRACVIAMRVWF